MRSESGIKLGTRQEFYGNSLEMVSRDLGSETGGSIINPVLEEYLLFGEYRNINNLY